MKCLVALLCSVGMLAALPLLAAAQDVVGHWTFEPGMELVDLAGNFGDVALNGATIADGQLDLGVGEWAAVTDYAGPDITEKTLVAWVILEDLDVQAGSVLTIDKISVDEFDGIIFGERQPHRWMNGSSFFRRTEDLDPGFEETETGVLVQVAISYQDDGGQVHLSFYRNGESYGEYTLGDIVTWTAGDAEVFFGKRHGDFADGGPGDLDARIEEARIYGAALSQAQIQALTLTGATAVDSRSKLATRWATLKAD